MLELRPVCEHCAKALEPADTSARICSFECTFCATCVEEVLGNVCPNCGGGFVPRPVRPLVNWRGDNYLGKFPPSTAARFRPVDPVAHADFRARFAELPPERR